jgi:hypothetical protein
MNVANLDETLAEGMDNIQTIYNSLNSQAKEIVKNYTKKIDDLIKTVSDNVNNLSNEDIRNIELQLSLMAYDLGELKDKTCIAAEIAEIIQDETEADAWNTAVGNNEQRKNTAILSSSKEKAVAKLYKLVASQIRTKLDEAHRVVDTLKSILISRASDRKLTDNYEGQ